MHVRNQRTGKLSDEQRTLEPVALTEEQRAVLEFAQRWYHRAGAREQAIRDELDMKPTQYAQVLNQLLDDADAMLEYPTLTRQLREQRERRLAQKVGRARLTVV
jgi:hypothetical protein